MISIFPLSIFHLYLAAFQQHIYMELLAPIRMSLIEDAANKDATETRVPIGKVEVITSKMLRLQPLWNICVTMTTIGEIF
jgi:hypothetical protein